MAEVRTKLAPGTPVEVWFQDEMRVGQKNKLTYRWAKKARVRAPRYALVQGRPDRPKFKAGNNVRVDTPAAEFGEAARAFAANFGTWSVNEADKTLIRRYEAALIPNAEGSETKVTVRLTGDELKLTGADAVGLRTDAVYRRAK